MRRTRASWRGSDAWFSNDSVAADRRRTASIRVEAALLLLHRQKRSSVRHRGGDLQAVPDNPGIGGQFGDSSRGVSRDLLGIEVAECATVALALVEHD